MSVTKNKRKLILLIILSLALLFFLIYNICWYIFYSSFKYWADSYEFEESFKHRQWMSYSQNDENLQISYDLDVPSYLGNFGQISVSQWLKINENPQSEYVYSQDMEYAICLRINKTIFKTKTFWVNIRPVKGVKKGAVEQDYMIHIDDKLSIIDADSYSEMELQCFEECKSTIEELYASLKLFYGEDNINDL